MEAGGLVELVPNRGVYVRSLDLATACAVYEVRAALFGMAGRCAAERVSDAQLQELASLVAEMERAAKVSDFDAYYPLNLAFHERILAASGNAPPGGAILQLDQAAPPLPRPEPRSRGRLCTSPTRSIGPCWTPSLRGTLSSPTAPISTT